jgi:hypothetical protein
MPSDMSHLRRFLRDIAAWLPAPELPPDPDDHFFMIDAARRCVMESTVSVEIWYGRRLLATMKPFPYRVAPIAHNPRGHGYSSQLRSGNDKGNDATIMTTRQLAPFGR